MAELTMTEANALIAKEVMGWDGTVDVFDSICWHFKDGGAIRKNNYTPCSDDGQMIKALRKWHASKDGRSWRIIDGGDVDDLNVSIYLWEDTFKRSTYWSTHESLALAVCTALCSALMGEQVTIKEQQ